VEVAAGGLALGGLADSSAAMHATAAGGLALGGLADSSAAMHATAAGGLALGGLASSSAAMHATAAGGLALGGLADSSAAMHATAAGGLALGGLASNTFTPGGISPGGSCASAGTITPGQSYSGTVPAFGVQAWFTFAVTSGTQYTVTLSGVTGFSAQVMISFPGSCPVPTFLAIQGGNGSYVHTYGSTGSAWLQIMGTSGAAYTIALTSP
jgi:hypothetical protein